MLTTVQACECAKEMEKWKSIVRLWYTGLSEGLPEYEIENRVSYIRSTLRSTVHKIE